MVFAILIHHQVNISCLHPVFPYYFFMYNRSLFIFRQDLRLHDNTGLIRALRESKEVLPIFIRDTRADEDFGENDPRFGFIAEALTEIDTELQKNNWTLLVYRGIPEKLIPELLAKYLINAVYANKSYSPRGKLRDEKIQKAIGEIPFILEKDFLLLEPEDTEQRKVFTPFYKLWQRKLWSGKISTTHYEPHSCQWIQLLEKDKNETIEKHFPTLQHPYFTMAFGRKRISDFHFSQYDETRNFPAIDGSTRLSPYIRFGVFSIREAYNRVLSESPTLVSELAWREFWYHIAHYFPTLYDLEFQEKRRGIAWENSEFLKEKIEQAETGYPLIDAALRQLYTTNWMHNRLRMVVASFITKNCLIDWRWGEKLFKKYLIDYDEAVNYGNWQWSASVGPDPKPLRIFNPLLQSEKFDHEAKFIKKYIPELANVSPEDIHSLNLEGLYPRPIVNQRLSADRAKEVYYAVLEK